MYVHIFRERRSVAQSSPMTLAVTILNADITSPTVPLGCNAWFVLALDGSQQVSSPAFQLSPHVSLLFTTPFAYAPSAEVTYLYFSLCTYRGQSMEVIALARARSRVANMPLTGVRFTIPLVSAVPPAAAVVTLGLSITYTPAYGGPIPGAAPLPQPQLAPPPQQEQPLYPPFDGLDDDNPYANLPNNPGGFYPS
jgi:hypothetical protein